jgi:hypothetical protein
MGCQPKRAGSFLFVPDIYCIDYIASAGRDILNEEPGGYSESRPVVSPSIYVDILKKLEKTSVKVVDIQSDSNLGPPEYNVMLLTYHAVAQAVSR